ncbi:MAG: hypothetical protein ISR61_07485 [Desulfobacteraceae bacterium]|nr:hypothetical protein [Desulfobacteraceae bacterium]MBL7217420.1 hypothetical protein [Desulfobacteraceae bacterium]
MNILFVCSANVCRSFLAENLLKQELEKENIKDISVASAGLNTFDLNEPDRKMVAHLSKIGIPPGEHRPKQISKQDVDWANIILVMETDHAKKIMDLWPEAKTKLQVFGRFVSAGPSIDDVIDPFGKSSYHYRLAQSQITLAINNFVQLLLMTPQKGAKSTKIQIAQ